MIIFLPVLAVTI